MFIGPNQTFQANLEDVYMTPTNYIYELIATILDILLHVLAFYTHQWNNCVIATNTNYIDKHTLTLNKTQESVLQD